MTRSDRVGICCRFQSECCFVSITEHGWVMKEIVWYWRNWRNSTDFEGRSMNEWNHEDCRKLLGLHQWKMMVVAGNGWNTEYRKCIVDQNRWEYVSQNSTINTYKRKVASMLHSLYTKTETWTVISLNYAR